MALYVDPVAPEFYCSHEKAKITFTPYVLFPCSFFGPRVGYVGNDVDWRSEGHDQNTYSPCIGYPDLLLICPAFPTYAPFPPSK